ncbi:hypothetical protein HanXRQr2_Chr12g0555791 [Helianthus annuus]|uniref:Uncharacterized protein n=1 Tax=Helianthus annuus TaxID=4232 RepID=A0A9K3MX95_HELAN|nr:hypothetical protein HanXRQr2_Chr12g0555791 [Helianthus annuus]KAJ0863876.1 hypothetical protein HanPSC8_Chr12g0535091 [Helianthus annuus]
MNPRTRLDVEIKKPRLSTRTTPASVTGIAAGVSFSACRFSLLLLLLLLSLSLSLSHRDRL